MEKPKIVSQEESPSARRCSPGKRKLTHLRDQVSAERRQLPWVKITKEYVFDTLQGRKTLSELFEGRSQLIVGHFMFSPEWHAGCVGCSFANDHVDAAWQHLKHHDVTYVAVGRAPLAMLEAYRKRMQWHFNFVSSYSSDFNYDFHVSFTREDLADGKVFYNYEETETKMEDLPGASVFTKDEEGAIYHTYSQFGRGGEEVLSAYMLLDLTPKGRNETHAMSWVKRHDEYGDGARRVEAA